MAPSTVDREIRTRRVAPESYPAYLNSSHWRTVRNRALQRAGWRCKRCGAKRDLNVHHVSYERLGAELDSDLEVLCFACHNGHHVEASHAEPSGVYVKLVSEVVRRNPFAQVADIADETKRACLRHKLPIDVALIDKAISLVCATRLKDGKAAYRSVVEVDESQPEAPMSHAQAVELLARLRTMVRGGDASTLAAKPMPKVKLVPRHQADRVKAFSMITREIEDSIARCEALEAEAKL